MVAITHVSTQDTHAKHEILPGDLLTSSCRYLCYKLFLSHTSDTLLLIVSPLHMVSLSKKGGSRGINVKIDEEGRQGKDNRLQRKYMQKPYNSLSVQTYLEIKKKLR